MMDFRNDFIQYHLDRVKNDLDALIDLLLDLSIEPDLNDLIKFFQVILDYRGLKKFIEMEK